MKVRTMVFVIASFTLVCTAVAQEATAPAKPAEHHHYKLIDMGLKSYINGFD